MNENTRIATIWIMGFITIWIIVYLIFDNQSKYDDKIKEVYKYYYHFQLPDKRSIGFSIDEKVVEK